jgi:hypothetical protein
MELNEKIAELEEEELTHRNALNTIQAELEYLKKSKQPTIKELFIDLDNIIKVTNTVKNYQYILGGDGRSAPWDETRNGKVATITISKEYYLSYQQRKIIKEYVETLHNPDHVEFIDKLTN